MPNGLTLLGKIVYASIWMTCSIGWIIDAGFNSQKQPFALLGIYMIGAASTGLTLSASIIISRETQRLFVSEERTGSILFLGHLVYLGFAIFLTLIFSQLHFPRYD